MSVEEQCTALCRNVTALRKQHGLSKREMAKILGVGVNTLTQMEQGNLPKSFRAGALLRIQDRFGVSIQSLLYLPEEDA